MYRGPVFDDREILGGAGPTGDDGDSMSAEDGLKSEGGNVQPTRVRQNFVETWLWTDSVVGYYIVFLPLPEQSVN